VTGSLTGAVVQTHAAYLPFNVVSASGTIVRVDLGARRAPASSLRRATVLTPTGAVRANFARAERVGERLCGSDNEDGKECHYEAVLRAHARVNGAVAVLPGAPDVLDVSPIAPGTDGPVDDALTGWKPNLSAATPTIGRIDGPVSGRGLSHLARHGT
jgi:hypothetical protein